jgi:hypothetical protein
MSQNPPLTIELMRVQFANFVVPASACRVIAGLRQNGLLATRNFDRKEPHWGKEKLMLKRDQLLPRP